MQSKAKRAPARASKSEKSAGARAGKQKIVAPVPATVKPKRRRPRASAQHARSPGASSLAKAERIRTILDQLIPEVPIPLDHRDPFTLLVAVLLSAQTTDARVNLVTPALFARADNAHAMSTMSVDEIRALIRTCGLAPGKAKNLAALSRLLVERHGGEVPRSFAELEALPGVGHKTASVVMAQAFGVPAFPVDTHIHRLAARWGLSNGSNVERTERDLKALYAEQHWNRLHLQIIYFGRRYCPALRHDSVVCPICSWASEAVGTAASARRSVAGARTVRPRRVADRA